MLASLRWLSELTGLDLQPDDVATRLTSAGLEVEGVHSYGEGLEHVVVARVVSARPHPEREKLQLVTVDAGEEHQEIVCGASNVPAPGGLVVLAKLGARLPSGMEISERKLGGVVSRGMLCGETELGIGSDDSGLLILDPELEAAPGTSIVEALGLRDTVIEIGLTPNRPDCLGHVGIARELGAIYGRPMLSLQELPKVSRLVSGAMVGQSGVFSLRSSERLLARRIEEDSEVPSFSVDIVDEERCPRYGAALVQGAAIAPSPFWVRYRLHVLGQRAINNVVDATNLILLGFGHPIHAFDYDRLRGGKVVVRSAGAGESLTTLDGVKRELSAEDLLICDGEGPIALAGVMGGENSEIHEGTSRVLIECAYFKPQVIRRTAKRLGMHTEASHRFERGVDPEAVRHVLAHAASLIARLAGGQVLDEAIDLYPKLVPPARIILRLPRMKALLGAEVPPHRARTLLRGLGCDVKELPSRGLEVLVPTHRPDLLREVDLIEEVARLAGYDTIPTQVPIVHPSEEGTAASVIFIRRVREAAAAAGLNEAINFAFVAPADLGKARQPTDAVELANPMSEDRSVLRTGLLAGLSGNLLLAQRHQQSRFAQFELSRVFAPSEQDALPRESYRLGLLLWGERASWIGEGELMDFYDLKGALEAMVASLGVRDLTTQADDALEGDAPYLHPRRRARVVVAGQAIGVAGELHPDVVDELGLMGRPQYAEVDVMTLHASLREIGLPQASVLPRFPASVRDLAVAVPVDVAAGQVAGVLKGAGGPLVEDVRLFDIYTGPPVPEGHKSLAYHVVYRDHMTTLTDKDVDAAHAKVVRSAEREFAASVRK